MTKQDGFLILNRRQGETVVLEVAGRTIKVTILGGNARTTLGFNAPKDVMIYREEFEDDVRRTDRYQKHQQSSPSDRGRE